MRLRAIGRCCVRPGTVANSSRWVTLPVSVASRAVNVSRAWRAASRGCLVESRRARLTASPGTSRGAYTRPVTGDALAAGSLSSDACTDPFAVCAIVPIRTRRARGACPIPNRGVVETRAHAGAANPVRARAVIGAGCANTTRARLAAARTVKIGEALNARRALHTPTGPEPQLVTEIALTNVRGGRGACAVATRRALGEQRLRWRWNVSRGWGFHRRCFLQRRARRRRFCGLLRVCRRERFRYIQCKGLRDRNGAHRSRLRERVRRASRQAERRGTCVCGRQRGR